MSAPTGSLSVSPDPIAPGRPCLTRSHHLTGSRGSSALSNGTLTWAVTQQRHLCIVDAASGTLRLVFENVSGYEDIYAAIVDVPNSDITVSATFWTGGNTSSPNTTGTAHDVTFDAASSVILQPGQVVVSDPIPGVALTAGQTYWTRTMVQVASGGQWPLGRSTAPILTEGVVSGIGAGPGTDYLHTGTIAQGSVTDKTFHPVASLATTSTATPVIGVVGTSIANGSGADNDESHIVQACKAAGFGYVAIAKGGDSAGHLKTAGGHRARYSLLGPVTDVICEHGVNDVTGGTPSPSRNFVAISGSLREIHRQVVQDLGKRVWQMTIPPSYNSSTDTWATVENQTPGLNDAVRVQVNDWIRAGCPENGSGVPQIAGTSGTVVSPFLSGWFETADTVESARNSGKWKATGVASGYTADGIHPSQTGHAAMAAAIDLDAIQTAYDAAGGPPPDVTPPVNRIVKLNISGTPTAIRLP